MKWLKDKKIIILMIVLIVFSISYFVVANKVSYAFANNYDLTQIYKNKIETIKKCAVAYAQDNLELFKDENIIYVKVQDLIDKNYLATTEDGKITNPIKENSPLNSNIIKIKYENNKLTVEVDA